MVNYISIILISISIGLLVIYYFMEKLYSDNEILERMNSKVNEQIFDFENVETTIIDRKIYNSSEDIRY